jgi:hypothetical protein
VALFKNGFGFFISRAELPADRAESSFLLPAVPVHGTFWLAYPPDLRLVSVVAERAQAEGERLEAITIPEILKANVGRQVRITLDEQQISGRITHFTEDRRRPRIMPFGPDVPEAAERPQIWPPYETGLALIDVDGATLSLDPREIRHVTFPDGDPQRHFARTRDAVAIHVQTAAPTRQQGLTVSFLARGIAWAPSYLVDLGGQGQARLSAKALIVNEMYDLENVSVQLVTGFPRLQFAEVRSPIGMTETLAQFLAALAGPRPEAWQLRQRAFAMAEAAPMAYDTAVADIAPAYGAAEAGVTAEDLFLYPAGRITLRPDRVAYIPLFTEVIPYEDLYKWEIPDYVDEAGRFLVRTAQPDDRRRQEVWHSIRLENTTRVPWTPAPATVARGNMIVGQAELPYTPSGDEATLRISRAADITAEQQEFEVERRRGVRQLYEMYYDLVTVRGELTVTNFKDRAVSLEIVKTLSGEVVSTDPPTEIERLAAGARRLDGVRRLTWTIDIDPGQTREVTYTYEVHVRGERAPAAPRPLMRGAPEPALR